jgi:hypothetical protein
MAQIEIRTDDRVCLPQFGGYPRAEPLRMPSVARRRPGGHTPPTDILESAFAFPTIANDSQFGVLWNPNSNTPPADSLEPASAQPTIANDVQLGVFRNLNSDARPTDPVRTAFALAADPGTVLRPTWAR